MLLISKKFDLNLVKKSDRSIERMEMSKEPPVFPKKGEIRYLLYSQKHLTIMVDVICDSACFLISFYSLYFWLCLIIDHKLITTKNGVLLQKFLRGAYRFRLGFFIFSPSDRIRNLEFFQRERERRGVREGEEGGERAIVDRLMTMGSSGGSSVVGEILLSNA